MWCDLQGLAGGWQCSYERLRQKLHCIYPNFIFLKYLIGRSRSRSVLEIERPGYLEGQSTKRKVKDDYSGNASHHKTPE